MTDFMETNRRRWDESVAIHVNSATDIYPIDAFRAGKDVLLPIESAEIGDVRNRRLAHLQCHFGLDTLCLARRGAKVTGLDYSGEAITAARKLAADCGLDAEFVESDVYAATECLKGPFDIVYVSWGALNWLPDIQRWAEVVAGLLAPGGFLYLLEGHPAIMTLEQMENGSLAPLYPYFPTGAPLAFDEEVTYTGDTTKLANTRTYEWIHPLGEVIGALLQAGLQLDFLHEHDRLAWSMFPMMEADGEGMFRLPADHPTLPLAYSLKAVKSG